MTNNKSKNPSNRYSSDIYAKTKKYQKIYGFGIGEGKHDAWNNEADAFKHTFAAVDMVLKTNAGISKITGDFHEYQGRIEMGQSAGEENMDRWNNAEGRKIAQKIAKQIGNPAKIKILAYTGQLDDLIAEEVMHKMRKGDLITHPDDPRKYKNTRTPGEKFTEKIITDYFKMKNAKLQRVFGKSKSNNSHSSNGAGRWVTINGVHVYIE